jgi:hypothetical protein
MAKRRKKIKAGIRPLDVIVLGVGGVAAYFIYKAVSGSGTSSNTGGGNTGGNTGGGTGGNTGGGTGGNTGGGSTGSPSSGWSGNNTPEAWADFWETYAIPGCYIDCSYRYDIIKQTQEGLNNAQIVDVSNLLKTRTGKNMYQIMSAMTWFGGPYSNNKAEQLYARLQTLSL